jgi:hypothetical protein
LHYRNFWLHLLIYREIKRFIRDIIAAGDKYEKDE